MCSELDKYKTSVTYQKYNNAEMKMVGEEMISRIVLFCDNKTYRAMQEKVFTIIDMENLSGLRRHVTMFCRLSR
jgi:hypothetical protein